MSTRDLRWLYQNLRPSTPSLGLSGGIGPIVGGPGCPPMTKKEIELCAVRPNNFTGKWRGVHYYKGKRWEGPTNMVGAGPQLVMVERGGHGWGIRAIGTSAQAAE